MRHGNAACSICCKPLSIHEVVRGGVCNALACKAALAKQARDRDRQTYQAALDAAAACVEIFGDHVDRSSPICIGAVPFSGRAVAPADPARVAAFRASLATEIHDAFARLAEAPADAAEDAADSAGVAVLGAACAVCQGRCCEPGGTHAFLTAFDLASKLARDPPVSAEALLESYMALLPDRSYEGSCVYHTERGCALPRRMRADLCNRYRCAELEDFACRYESATGRRAVIAAVTDGEVRRAVVVEGDRVIARHPELEEQGVAGLDAVG